MPEQANKMGVDKENKQKGVEKWPKEKPIEQTKNSSQK